MVLIHVIITVPFLLGRRINMLLTFVGCCDTFFFNFLLNKDDGVLMRCGVAFPDIVLADFCTPLVLTSRLEFSGAAPFLTGVLGGSV